MEMMRVEIRRVAKVRSGDGESGDKESSRDTLWR